MEFVFSFPRIKADTPCEKKAAEIFAAELKKRLPLAEKNKKNDFVFHFSENKALGDRDAFAVECKESGIVFKAQGIRGLIYAQGLFLRKSVTDGRIMTLLCDITGEYRPDKKIRGHQLGYRQCSNTYDAWDIEAYKRYYLELMFFGTNTVEHIPYERGFSSRNELMKYDEQELLCEAASEAAKLDLDVSLWYPNSEETAEEACKNREKLFSECRHIAYVFCPGSDPGSLSPEQLFARCGQFKEILLKYHPNAKVLPSAQQPHGDFLWGSKFIDGLRKHPYGADGIITGPNAAFEPDVLRKNIPAEYPIRLYPDITHNVRCEYPVHFDRNDWHYALAAANGRESINPRPSEYRKIHEQTRGYAAGSVTYSEGINDDINKAVWSALDFDPFLSPREILEDYSRLFFPFADYEKAADGIFGLEKNWEGAPEENPQIENTLKIWLELGGETPSLYESWRYISCLFRAQCDALVRRKTLFELPLLRQAKSFVTSGFPEKAAAILDIPYPENITNIRKGIEINAEKLYNMIGLQLSAEKYHASGTERGAVLDTIDLPVTNRQWLRKKLEAAAEKGGDAGLRLAKKCVNRNTLEKDEYYYSAALCGLSPGGAKQLPGFYLDFQGDFPDKNNGSLPVCLFQLFDHFVFKCKAAGLKYDTDYIMQVTYKDSPNPKSTAHTVKINGNIIYRGKQFGDCVNRDFERDLLPEGYTAVMYLVPAKSIINGCADIEIAEPLSGFEIAELRMTKKAYASETEEFL